MKNIAIVTGASAGLGYEFAQQIDREYQPDELWLVARREDRLQQLITRLRPGVGVAVVADLSQPEGCQILIKKLAAASKKEPITLVTFVNNAGHGTYGTFEENDIDWQLSMIDLNVRALTELSHAALRYMNRGSTLINVGSLASFFALGNFAVYAATKAYVLSFSLAIGAEVADRGIKVCTLCPGPVDTEFSQVASRGARTAVMHGRSPQAVVHQCLRAARHGKATALYGFQWKFQAFLARFIGRKFSAKFSYKNMTRPSAAS